MARTKRKMIDAPTPAEASPSVLGESQPLEDLVPHANNLSPKQQLLAHLDKVENVVEYMVLSEKDGVHSIVSTLPTEINDLIGLFKAGAISKYQNAIISVILRESADKLDAYHKALSDQQKKAAGFTEKKLIVP